MDRSRSSQLTTDSLTDREIEILRLIAEGMSNAEIAQRLVITLGTVKWYNGQIFDKLGVKNRTQAIARARELHLFVEDVEALSPASEIQRSTIRNFPAQATPLIGRSDEIKQIMDLLCGPECRLLTLVGPGGVGKTRTATEAVEHLAAQFADGVYFVGLSTLSSPDELFVAIANALDLNLDQGGDPRYGLLAHLKTQQCLIMLDDFDELLDGAPLVAEILQAAPGISILATSRERLNLREETVLRLDGMPLPAGEAESDLVDNSAVALFIESARRTNPNIRLTDEDLQDIVTVCRLVEGLPLAILLAATWTELLTPKEITAEISQNIDFLETRLRNLPERHRSMRAVFESTWSKMSETDRMAFARLSVFRGGFTREAAQRVTNEGLTTLMALAGKSLVRRDSDGRFGIHELLRQFALSYLFELGKAEETGELHCRYYLEMVATRNQPSDPVPRIDADWDNIRAAWSWAIDHGDYVRIDNTVQSLYQFCISHSRYYEGVKCFDSALQTAARADPAVDPHTIIRLRECRGSMRAVLGDFEAAFEDLQAVLEVARKADKPDWERELLIRIAQLYRRTERNVEGITYLTQVINAARAASNQHMVADALYHRGTIYWSEGDNRQGRRCHEEAAGICRALGLRDIVAIQALHGLGESLFMAGYPDLAIQTMSESLELAREVGDISYEAENNQMIGWAYIRSVGIGDGRKGVSHLERALVLSENAHLDWHVTCSLIGLGMGYSGIGDYGKALEYAQHGYERARTSGIARFQALALDGLGQIYQDLALWQKAEETHRKGMEVMYASESTFFLSRLQANWVIDRMRQGNLAGAEKELTEALDLSITRHQEFHTSRCLEGLAELAILRKRPDVAKHYAAQLLELAEGRNLRESIAQAHRWRAEALLLEGNVSEAVNALSSALMIANELEILRLQWDLHALLAPAFERLGKNNEKTEHQKLVRQTVSRIAATVNIPDLRAGLPDYTR